MHLDTPFLLAEFNLSKNRKTQVNSCRVENISVTAKFENMINTLLSCFTNKVVNVFFKDMIVSILICSCQR